MSVRGIPQAIAAFERRKLQAKVAEPVAAQAGGRVVQADMVARAPRDTGALAASIVVEMEGDTAHVGPTVPYARFVEFGTRYMEGQPFVSEAAEDESPIVAAMAAIFKLAMR